jgi:hypothetical protein
VLRGGHLLASLLVIVVSSALFLYWFRYTCLLLLAQRGDTSDALKVASTIRLSFPGVQEAIQAQQPAWALDCLHDSLEQDYQILTDLLRQTTESESIQRRILTIDYKVMQLWYKVARTSPSLLRANKAIEEMSSILSFFAAEFCETTAG